MRVPCSNGSVAGENRVALGCVYIYGFPPVFDLEQVDRFVRQGIGGVPASSFNRFGHASTLAGRRPPVSINNDTVYPWPRST